MKHRLVITVLGLLSASFAFAQVPDVSQFGTWTGISASKELSKKWSLDGEVELRTQDAFNAVDRWSASLGAQYKFNKYLKIEASYKYLYNYYMADWKTHYSGTTVDGYNVAAAHWMPRNRFMLDITGQKKFGRFALSLTERFQLTTNGSMTVDRDKWRYSGNTLALSSSDTKIIDAANKLYLRTRLMAKYDIPHSHFTPYAGYYLYNDLRNDMNIKKYRLAAGTEFSIDKHNSISLGYVYVNSHDDDEQDDNILQLSYGIKF
jgi:hypothetical protein